MAAIQRLRLPRDGAEYLTLTADISFTAAEIEVDGVWHLADPTATGARILVRGPEASTTDGVLLDSDTTVRVRLTSDEEIIVRGVAYLVLVG